MKYTYSKNHHIENQNRNVLVRIWSKWEELVGIILKPLLVQQAQSPGVRQNNKMDRSRDSFSFIGMFHSFRNRRFLFIASVLLVVLGAAAFLSLKYLKPAEATQWWPDGGTSYSARKQLTVTNNSASNLSSGTTVAITINTKALYDAQKLQSDCDDLRVVYQPSNSTTAEVTRHLVYPSGTTCSTSTNTKAFFKLQATLNTTISTTDYFAYYGNTQATAPSSTDAAFNVSSATATLVCPFDGSTTCAAGETPSTESGTVRYSGSKGAMNFDGVNDQITTPSISSTNIGTYEFWIKPQIINGNYGWIDTSSAFDIFQWTTNSLYFRAGNQSAVSISSWTPNTWHHVAMTWNGSNYYGYLDGTQVTSGVQSGSMSGIISLAKVDGLYYFPGQMDEVRVSNIVRYTSTFTPSTTPLVRDSNTLILLHFDENGDDPRNTGKAIDDSGNGNHGTITGAKYVSGLVGVDGDSTAPSSWSGAIGSQSYAKHEGIFIEEGTTNKITNPSFENSTYDTNWDAVGANLTASANTTAPYYKFGSKSLKLVASATAISGTSNMDTIGIDPDSTATHTISFYAYDGTTGNVGGTVSSSIVKPVWEGVAQAGGTYTDMGGGWWRVTYATTTTDATNEYGVEVQVSKTVYIDSVQLEALSHPTTYTDGTLGTGYAWTGTAHESTSSRTA